MKSVMRAKVNGSGRSSLLRWTVKLGRVLTNRNASFENARNMSVGSRRKHYSVLKYPG